MRKKILLLSIFMFSWCLSLSSEIKEVKFCEDPWPPYTYGKVGEITEKGIATDIINELFSRMDIKVTNKLLPWKRCLLMVEKGKQDGAMMLTKNSEREEYMEFSIPIIENRDMIWYKKGNSKIKEWNSFEDLKPYIIGNSLGFNYGKEFEKSVVEYNLKVDVAKIDELNFKKLDKGRIDVFFCNETAANTIFSKNKDLKDKFISMEKSLKNLLLNII